MRLCFVDESGHPHPNDPVSRPVLLATCLPIEQMRDLTRRVYNAKQQFFGDASPWLERKFKAKAVLNERTFRRVPEKWRFVEHMFQIAQQTPNLKVAVVVMQRPARPLEWDANQLPAYWHYLLLQVQAIAAADGPTAHAIVIPDSQNERDDANLSVQFGNYLYRSSAGQAMTHIAETPLFVSSHLTPGIQIADLFAACIRLYHEHHDGSRVAGP